MAKRWLNSFKIEKPKKNPLFSDKKTEKLEAFKRIDITTNPICYTIIVDYTSAPFKAVLYYFFSYYLAPFFVLVSWILQKRIEFGKYYNKQGGENIGIFLKLKNYFLKLYDKTNLRR